MLINATQTFLNMTVEKIVSESFRLPALNALRAFDAAGRTLNFRAAADTIGVTQGAVAQHVRALEADLGVRLFERHRRGLAFTDAGRAYHARIAQAFEQLTDATAAFRPDPRRVTISVTPTFASKWLIPRLTNLTDRHPDIDLHVLATDSVLSFHADGIDLAVRQARPPFGAGVTADRLFGHTVIAVCAPALVEARRDADVGSLTGLALLHDSHDLWPAFLAGMGWTGPATTAGPRFNQTAHAIDAALAGHGVALASRFLVEHELSEGRLVQPVDHAMEADLDFHVLGRRPGRASAAASRVRAWLLDHREAAP